MTGVLLGCLKIRRAISFSARRFQAECLKRWHLGTAKAVAAAVGKETLLRPTAETVENFAKFLMRMSLTREAGLPRGSPNR